MIGSAAPSARRSEVPGPLKADRLVVRRELVPGESSWIYQAATAPGFVTMLIGLLSAFYVPFGGQLYVGELVLVTVLPLALAAGIIRHRARLGMVALAIAFWAVGLWTSSALNHSQSGALISALASAAMFLVSLLCLCYVVRTYADLRWLLIGITVGYSAACLVQPNTFFAGSPWKFGFALPVTLLVVMLAQRLQSKVFRLALLLAVASMSLINDYRTMALFVLFIAAWHLVPASIIQKIRSAPMSAVLIIAPLAAGAGFALAALYARFAASGALGEGARVRLDLQGGGSPLLMMLGGRNEIFYSLPGALARPLNGYGADPQLPLWLSTLADRNLAHLGLFEIAEADRETNLLPTHSIIMGAWIEGGILGLVCWLLILLVIIAALPRALTLANDRWPVIVFVLLNTIWNIAFSPFGATTRFFTAMAVCVALLILQGHGAVSRSGQSRLQEEVRSVR